FKAIGAELSCLKVKASVLDGEVVTVNEKGVSDFGALQDALSTSGLTGELIYYAFDLLYLDGCDLRGCASASTTPATGLPSSTARAGWGWRASCRSGAPRHTRPDALAAGSRPNA